MIKQALIHVENTDGIIEFARFLSDSGWTLLSANKTEDLLKKEDIPVTKELSLVENNTYINDTSTLLQRILSSNYFDADSNQNNQDEIIGIICMNIVPALHSIQNEQKLKSITKHFNYSISTILRTSFMNYENLLILSDPSDYKEAMIQLRTNNITEDFKTYLGAKALNLISAFDSGIASSVLMNISDKKGFLRYLSYPYEKQLSLRKGSNKQQNACLYKLPGNNGTIVNFQKQQGKELTYNKISDISFAWEQISLLATNLKNQFSVKSTNCDGYNFVTQFTPLTGTIFTIAVKYKSILGAALATNVIDSFRNTYTYDSDNIHNVTLACSAVIDKSAAEEIINCNIATIVAPGFTSDAKEIFSKNKDISLVQTAKIEVSEYDLQLINGGILFQTKDNNLFSHWDIKTKNRPSQYLTDEMAFGMLLARCSRTYSTVLLKNNAIIGLSQACKSPVLSISAALEEANILAKNKPKINNDDNILADLLVCDSAIPLCDSVKELIDKGIKAIIQTGGLPCDNEFINYCNEHEVTMIFTGMTHISY